MIDCKKCKRGVTLFVQTKEDRHTTLYSPSGFVRCSGSRYGSRSFFVRDSRACCEDYEPKEKQRRAE